MNKTDVKPVKVLRSFSTILDGGTFVTFEEGIVIREFRIIEQLLKTGCKTYLADEDEASRFATCSKCHAICDIEQSRIDVHVAKESISLQMGTQFLTYRKGDLLRHSNVIEAALAAGYDLEPAKALKCSRCDFVF